MYESALLKQQVARLLPLVFPSLPGPLLLLYHWHVWSTGARGVR